MNLVSSILLIAGILNGDCVIVWGNKPKITTIDSGSFKCPLCNVITEYELKEACQYFTLFWVPLFPYGDVIKYLECQQCKTAFKPEFFDIQNNDVDCQKEPSLIQEDGKPIGMHWEAITVIVIGCLIASCAGYLYYNSRCKQKTPSTKLNAKQLYKSLKKILNGIA